tara:strand:- start:1660 stop:1959 length:300 start_codon:yes stop_codon:yes gene_type:complete
MTIFEMKSAKKKMNVLKAEIRGLQKRPNSLEIDLTKKGQEQKPKAHTIKTIEALSEEVAGILGYLAKYSQLPDKVSKICRAKIKKLQKKILSLERLNNK